MVHCGGTQARQKQRCTLELLWTEKIFEIMSSFAAHFVHYKVVLMRART